MKDQKKLHFDRNLTNFDTFNLMIYKMRINKLYNCVYIQIVMQSIQCQFTILKNSFILQLKNYVLCVYFIFYVQDKLFVQKSIFKVICEGCIVPCNCCQQTRQYYRLKFNAFQICYFIKIIMLTDLLIILNEPILTLYVFILFFNVLLNIYFNAHSLNNWIIVQFINNLDICNCFVS